MRRSGTALALVAVGLAGAFLATWVLYRLASVELRGLLDERLKGAGVTGALLLSDRQRGAEDLAQLMSANELDGAYVIGANNRVTLDATGAGDRPVDWLRLDRTALGRARAGQTLFVDTFSLGQLEVRAVYVPMAASETGARDVLVLEAGHTFFQSEAALRRSLLVSLGLALLGGAALAVVALRSARQEQERASAVERGIRGETLAQLSAMAAHEIRNPLGIIRATIELMRERSGAQLGDRDRAALTDILQEVERLHRLAQDFLELASSRELLSEPVNVAELLNQVVQAAGTLHPGARFALDASEPLALSGDTSRLRQVFTNLLNNAAEAAPGTEVRITALRDGKWIKVRVSDQGPGVPPDLQTSLFAPFASTKAGGSGLGLALSRRLVERHRGKLELVPTPRGATFEVALPIDIV